MERRRNVRAAKEHYEHQISVAGIDGDWRVPAELINLTSNGAQLRLALAHAFPAPVSKTLTIWLCDKDSGISLPIEARLTHRREEGSNRVIGVSFVDQRTLGSLLHPLLGPIFNRRASLRVSPSKREGALTVALNTPSQPTEHPEEGIIVDISTGGLAIDAPITFEDQLAGRDCLEASFQLPGREPLLTTSLRIVHRTLRAEGVVRYGGQFLDTNSSAFHDTHDAILSYVIRRQREMAEEHELMSGEGIPLGALSRGRR